MSYDLELEELRQLQEIITRHEDHAFKIRGWMYAVVAGLTAALYGDKTPPVITNYHYLAVALASTLLFLGSELVHRAYVRLAIKRSSKVQWQLRDKKEPYDGPLISKSLAQELGFKSMLQEFTLASVWVHYVSLWVVVALIAVARK